MNTAHALAADLVDYLIPACERVAIAGSIRRGKPNPKDIELIAIPRYTQSADLFGAAYGEPASLLDVALSRLLDAGEWAFDTKLARNGKRYKRLLHAPSQTPLDLFIADPARWGVIFAIRTGDSEFSHLLVSHALRMGYHVHEGRLHGHRKIDRGSAGQDIACPSGDSCPNIIPTPEETDFFAALGLPYLEPSERTAERLIPLTSR